MRRLAAGAVLVGVLGVMFIATASPAGAASAKGCSGSGRSIGVNGDQIDTASAPGSGGTEDDPFTVETKGEIAYDYAVDRGALSNGKWTATIDTGLLGDIVGDVSFSGKIDAGSSQSGDGVEALEDHLNVGGLAALAGKFKITINARAGGIRCVVTGWLEIKDSPVKSIMFIEALVLFILAIILFYLAMAGLAPMSAVDEMLDMAADSEGKDS